MNSPNPLTGAHLAVASAAISGDSGRLYGLMSDLMAEGVPFDSLLFDLLMPTEQDVGRRWQAGDYLVSEEHAATATMETVVSLLVGSFDQPSDGVHVVIAAAEGDYHSFPGRLANAHLLHLGYRTTYLGANVLASDLADFLLIEPPDAVVISCAMTNHLPGARAAISECHAVGVPVVVGGRGFGPDGMYAGRLGADRWVANPREIADVLGSWDPDPSDAEARAVAPDHAYAAVTDKASSILAEALERFEAELGAPPDGRLRDELSILLGSARASLLVGDDGVIAEAVGWQRETFAAHGLAGSEALIQSLADSLRPYSPEAASALANASR